MPILTERRIEAIKLDLKGLSKTTATSLEITASITNSLVKDLAKRLEKENTNISEKETLDNMRKILFH